MTKRRVVISHGAYCLSAVLLGLLATFLFIAVVAPRQKPPSTWRCGNHEPAHEGRTGDEMRDATKRNGCKDWHRPD